jgi:hypothetical protein
MPLRIRSIKSQKRENVVMSVEVLRTTIPGAPKRVGKGGIAVEYGDVAIGFSEPRGYGESKYDAVIDTDSFETLAQAMLYAHPEEAVKAFGNALKLGVPKPMERWWPGRKID